MRLFIAPRTGTGAKRDAYRPAVTVPGRLGSYVLPDGRFLCVAPDVTAAPAGTVDLGADPKERLSGARLTRTAEACGVTSATVRNLTVGEALLATDAKFRGGRARTKIRVAGVDLYDAPAIRGGATDAFTYSNGALATVSSGVWVNKFGTLQVVGNQVANGSAFAAAVWSTAFNTDHYCQLDVVSVSTGGGGYCDIGVATRSVTGSAETYMIAVISTDSTNAVLYVASAGSYTQLDTATVTAAGTYRLTSEGSVHTVTRNGVEIMSATDSTLNANTRVGLLSEPVSIGVARGDNWEGGDVGGTPVTGTVAVTLGAFASAASGTVTSPSVTGTVAVTLGAFAPTASGIRTVPITGTVAVTLASFTSAASGVFSNTLYPATISGRKLLDQNGDVYLAKVMSSWTLADLSDADITDALEACQANGFNGVVVWGGGGYDPGESGWTPVYERKADSSDWWAGTPWASSLGPAWAAMDHIADETARLGMVLHFSFCGGFDATGARADWVAATNTNMRDVGIAVATRYAAHPHIVWHLMFDYTDTVGGTSGQRVNALFDGINDTEGATTRPVRWTEVMKDSSTDSQGWYDPTGSTTDTRFSINCLYSWDDDSVVDFEARYAETSGPTGDCEPRYVGNSSTRQQIRERAYAVFLEGGCLLNFGHEDWWPFGKDWPLTDGETWQTVQTDDELVDVSHSWTLIDTYCKDITYAPTSSFVTTGAGTGDTKAAIGASDTAALAYFPDNRTVVVDTTIIAGTGNVRLRWYDPTAGTYSSIAASEAQNASRSVTMPAARGDGTRDFVLVVDAVNDVTGTAAVTLGAFAPAASGTSTPPAFTGSVAVTLAAFTATVSGTYTPPAFTGTVAVTLAAFTSAASGTSTPPAFTGTAVVTLAAFTSTASGTAVPPPITGTVAVTLASFAPAASGTFTPLAITGTAAVTLGAFAAAGLGAFTPAGSGSAAITLAAFTSTASGTSTPPAFTGSAAVTLTAFTSTASGTVTDNAITGTVTVTLQSFTPAATGTSAPPAITGTAAVTLGVFVAVAVGDDGTIELHPITLTMSPLNNRTTVTAVRTRTTIRSPQ